LSIANGEGEFDQDVLILGNNFRTKYEQLLEAYNVGQCVMVLIKNVTKFSKGNQYLKAQHYTILTKVVDETIRTRILQLHKKLSSAQFAFIKVNSFPFLCIIQCHSKIYT
jgi:hypothetical protein